jgi:hypothetical protein
VGVLNNMKPYTKSWLILKAEKLFKNLELKNDAKVLWIFQNLYLTNDATFDMPLNQHENQSTTYFDWLGMPLFKI